MLCSVREIEYVVKLIKLKPSEDEGLANAPNKRWILQGAEDDLRVESE